MDLGRHYYELDPVNAMFLNCLWSSIVLEKSRVYSPFLFTDCLHWSSIPMILGFVFINIALIQGDRTILHHVCFPEIKTKTSKKASLLFCQPLSYNISSDRQV